MAELQDQKSHTRYMLFVFLPGEKVISQRRKLNYTIPPHETTDSQNINIQITV